MHDKFRQAEASGLKAKASEALSEFLASIGPEDNVQGWVRNYLEAGIPHPIRREIYERQVFPVLLEGYQQTDAWSLLWLGKTAQNLYRHAALHAQIDYKTAWHLFQESYDITPTEEARTGLLGAMLAWFRYSEHEWPAGILYGADGASLSECDLILADVASARALDGGKNAAFLQAYERKVREYKARLQCRAA